MGLDFRNGITEDYADRPNWSYGGFGNFRSCLAKQVGIEKLASMRGFGGVNDEWPDDPIITLIDHSDCDGILTPEECAEVAPRLAELIELFEGEEGEIHTGRGRLLVAMMRECAEQGVNLEFC